MMKLLGATCNPLNTKLKKIVMKIIKTSKPSTSVMNTYQKLNLLKCLNRIFLTMAAT